MHATLIDDLGGVRAVARALGVKNPNAVSNWRSRGVSWAWRPAVAKLAAARKLQLPANFLSPPKDGRSA